MDLRVKIIRKKKKYKTREKNRQIFSWMVREFSPNKNYEKDHKGKIRFDYILKRNVKKHNKVMRQMIN